MASVKAMFRASTVSAKQGVIYFQIILCSPIVIICLLRDYYYDF